MFWSVTPIVHIDDEIVDCEPILGKLFHSFLRLVGVVGDEDFGDLDLSRRFGIFGISKSFLLIVICDRFASIICTVGELSISVMVILFKRNSEH